MSERTCLAVILAAGEGTRMKSGRSKVLHEVAGLSMVTHVVEAARQAGVDRLALVVGHDAEAVEAAVADTGLPMETHRQTERLGTAHAVLAARPTLEHPFDDILVLFGDAPLLLPQTIARARAALASGADIAVIGFRTDKPDGYGRLIEDRGELVAIREHKDASEDERAIRFCNGGIMAIAGAKALAYLDAIDNRNAKSEFYLTDIVEIARVRGGRAVAVEAPAEELLGVNTRADLAIVEAIWQDRRRQQLMLDGVTMQAPDTVFLSHDTVIEPDVTLEPNIWFGPRVRVEAGATIRAFSHIEDAHVGRSAEVGPFARLRPGAELGEKAKVGNFCEVKKAVIGAGAKVNHLTYIGDASIGAGSNIGAGTITCNYDGYNKHQTTIGEGVFVGSNTSLVAPVTLGDGAYVASGSVIVADVPADALAFGRARQSNLEGRAKSLRARAKSLKEQRAAEKDRA
jgi:bifunctional UDP-N-acetylglucosamine pyrophosphorylase/glucosamine-1-phosphate N-acetyltransferase